MRTDEPGSPHRAARRSFRPSLARLEARELLATAVSSITALPAILNPPNNRFVAVTITGFVIDSSAKETPHAQYQVTDEYRRFEPSGRVTLTKILPTVYKFKFSVVLQARRAQTDLNGRHYYVAVGAQDSQNAEGLTIGLLVPHDKLAPGTPPVSSTVQLPTHHSAPKTVAPPAQKGLLSSLAKGAV